jgi:hypothetical protein
MKKEWTKIDSEMSGKGMKKAQADYDLRNIRKWEKERIKRDEYLKKHPEYDDSVRDGLCETCKEVYKDKVKRRFQKKRKKRYRKLWDNCVPLSNYKSRLIVNQDLVRERRRIRYEEAKCLYEVFVIKQKEKEEKLQIIIKDKSLKNCYGKPYERKYDNLDSERDMQTINQSSDVDGSGVATEDENLITSQIPKQNPAVECNQCLVIGKTSLISGEDPKNDTEEIISVKGFGTFYNFREVFTFVSKRIKKKFRLEQQTFGSRCFRLDGSDCECEAQTIYQSSAVDGSDVAADDDNLYLIQIPWQNSAIECTQNSEIGIISLISGTNPKIFLLKK